MRNLENNQRLLEDLVRDDINADLQAQLTQIGYRQARARVRRGHAVRGIALVTILIALSVRFGLQPKQPDLRVQQREPTGHPSYVALQTEPFQNVITSAALPRRQLLTSEAAKIAIVETSARKAYNEISDAQLFSFFEGKQIVLLRHNDRRPAELIFP